MDIIKGASTTDIIIPSSQLIKLELQSAGNDPCIKEIVKQSFNTLEQIDCNHMDYLE